MIGDGVDGVVDEFSVQWFCHEKVDAAIVCLFALYCPVMSRDHDHLDIGIVLFDVGDKIEPKTIREMVIKELDIWWVRLKRFDRIRNSIHKAGNKISLFQKAAE